MIICMHIFFNVLIEYYSPFVLSFLFLCFWGLFLFEWLKIDCPLIVLGGPVDTFPFFARRFKFFPIRSPHAREKTKI